MITQQQYDELKEERDALLAQLTDLRMAIAANYEFEITQGKPSKLAQEYLAEIRAEAGRAGYLQGRTDEAVISFGRSDIGIYTYSIERAADKYAATLRQGGAE